MSEKTFAALSVRKLKPGAWEAFRKGWDAREQGGDHPPFIDRIYHMRDPQDPDRVVSIGFATGDPDEVREFMSAPEWRELDAKRQAAMAPHVAETYVDSVFEVIEEIVPATLR
jgi:hypothetical protein